MDKADPDFQWKMPIEFYGIVVDQLGDPVANATVVFGRTTVVGPLPDPEQRVLSGSDGRFELTGVQGILICHIHQALRERAGTSSKSAAVRNHSGLVAWSRSQSKSGSPDATDMKLYFLVATPDCCGY